MSRAHISERHAKFLLDRAVEDAVAKARDYQTITDLLDVNARGYTLSAPQVPGLLMPLYDFNGEVWGHQYRPDRPRQTRGPKPKLDSRPRFNKYENPPGQEVHLDYPPGVRALLKDDKAPLVITEGPVKADAVMSAGYACIDLLGVGMWRCPDWNQMGSLRGRRVYIAFDSDIVTKKEVHKQLLGLVQHLRKNHGAIVSVVVIPAEPGEKVGIDDYIASGQDLAEMLEKSDAEVPSVAFKLPDGETRAPLYVGNPASLRDDLARRIGRGPLSGIFLRGEVLTRVPSIGEDGYIANDNQEREDWEPAQTRPIDARLFRALVSSSFYTYMKKEQGGNQVYVHTLPDGVACDLVVAGATENAKIPKLQGVVHTPVFLKRGRILDVPGYDADSQMLYLPNGLEVPVIPRRPTDQQVSAAIELIDSFIGKFPYRTPGDRANYYALLLTPFLRRVMPKDDVPFVAINAPQRGSGKSLLAAFARLVHGGVLRSEIPSDDEEIRKVITSILYTTTGGIIQFDNVTRVVKSGHLDMLFTSQGEWNDRPLGYSRSIKLLNDRVWVITGNNIAISGDLSRRMMWITIDANMPKPWTRKGFPDVIDDARKERGPIVAALLTIVRAWAAAGYPEGDIENQSFPRWGRFMSGLCASVGLDGFMDTGTDVGSSGGVEDEDWEGFLAAAHAIFEGRSFLAKQLAEECQNRPDLADTMPTDLAMKMEKGIAFTKSLGWWLRNRNGRWGENYVVRKLDANLNGSQWNIATREA